MTLLFLKNQPIWHSSVPGFRRYFFRRKGF